MAVRSYLRAPSRAGCGKRHGPVRPARHVPAAVIEPQASLEASLRASETIRNDWTRQEVQEVYDTPLLDLVFRAASVHRQFHNSSEVQKCTLLSIKTGGCTEDCKYCSQSSKHSRTTKLKASKLMEFEEVFEAAKRAKEAGSTRFCMGAAWRDTNHADDEEWQRVLEMVRRVRGLGLEVCTTLGMLTEQQASQLAEAGLTAYNHNLDTSPEFYPKIITTRTYEERLQTLENVRAAGISVCTGGIIGLGEAHTDRVGLLLALATLPKHPDSVPINALVPIEGTPLGDLEAPSGFELVRCVAAARVLMPRAMVRLSAGRHVLNAAEQALAFLAGANSIFAGDKLLTTPNADQDEDSELFETLGLRGRLAFKEAS